VSQLSSEHFPVNAKKIQKEYRTYGRDEITICRTGVAAIWVVRMTVHLQRAVQYYVTDYVAYSELHIRVGHYVPVNMSSVCFRAMRYHFVSQYDVNCTCFVQILLMTEFYNIWRNTFTMWVQWRSTSYLVVVGIGTRYRLDGSGFELRGGRDFSPQLTSLALRFTQPPVQWVPGLFPAHKVASARCWPPTPVRPLIFCVFMARYRKHFTFQTRRFSLIQAPAALVY
jgi:hypothetical protein